MGDPAPQRGIGRWIFLGCAGCGGLVLLSFAGCAGLLFYLYKGSEPIAAVGAEYLRKAPEVAEKLGTPLTVERTAMNWKVRLRNDGGSARMGYTVTGPKGGAEAVVFLIKTAGAWVARGARMGDVEIGDPPRESLRDSIDWDD